MHLRLLSSQSNRGRVKPDSPLIGSAGPANAGAFGAFPARMIDCRKKAFNLRDGREPNLVFAR